jgi:hypothetical protein
MQINPNSKAPTVRLATAIEGGGAQSPAAFERHLPSVPDPDTNAPGLLVSYVYLTPFLKNRHLYAYRDWVLDSGAFSAHNSGTEITLQSYIDVCKQLMDSDPTLSEIFALDVIGDWRASLENCEEMWRQGVPAIPCYHRGEPEHVLKTIAQTYPKIALGGVAMLRGDAKMEWAKNCFAHIWPCKVHGFGFGSESQVMGVPWHSVDATNWEIGPCKFGRWNSYGQLSVRGSKQNLRSEVEWYLKLERKARGRWRREMAKLAQIAPKPAEIELSVRLATAGTAIERIEPALSAKPNTN